MGVTTYCCSQSMEKLREYRSLENFLLRLGDNFGTLCSKKLVFSKVDKAEVYTILVFGE